MLRHPSAPNRSSLANGGCVIPAKKGHAAAAPNSKKLMGEKHWTERSKASGQFMDQKKEDKFKGVRREK
jgi:hypothetical protein